VITESAGLVPFGSELSARRYRGSWTNWTGLLKAKEAESMPAERQIGSGAANIPLGRMARPEEIAAAMLFLASEDNSFAAGSRLLVDGGRCSV
jgi:NAD(P)-dependent dehydrogenase (short-subunit alcohol dehydrogenase family)